MTTTIKGKAITTVKLTAKQAIAIATTATPKPDAHVPLYVTIESHNEPLRQAMFDRGCEWKVGDRYEHFTKDGEYASYPVGYIRGPHSTSPGNPNRYQYSVQGHSGWWQRSFPSISEGQRWALETAVSVLSTPKDESVEA
jgi:hypothetical protein